MAVTCARHTSQTAWWQCPRCFKTLCPLCIARKAQGLDSTDHSYFCPICGVEAHNLELFRVLAPLWERLPRFLAYPFTAGSSAILIPALAFLATLFARWGLFPAAAQFALWSITVTYAIAALNCTSTGSFRPPPIGRKIWKDHPMAVFRQVLLYSAFYALYLFLIAEAPIWLVLASTIACAMALPAILMLLSVHENLFRALHPLHIIRLISRLGGTYYQLACFLLMLIGIPAILGYSAGSHLPVWCRTFLTAAVCNYVTIVVYHITGYILLLYHRHLDFPVDFENVVAALNSTGALQDHGEQTTPRTTADDDLLITTDRLVQKGDLEEAIRRIEMHTKTAQLLDLDLSHRYLELLRRGRHPRKFLSHAAHHLELLAKSGYNAKALSLYMECIRIDKNFAPQALVLFKLAGWLDETGKSREAVYVLNCLIKRHPQNNMVPKALYRVAQISHQGMKDAERSKKVLTGLIQRFPDHEISVFARNYLNGL
jgi:tetratricopeptide (TPR) repeat protein